MTRSRLEPPGPSLTPSRRTPEAPGAGSESAAATCPVCPRSDQRAQTRPHTPRMPAAPRGVLSGCWGRAPVPPVFQEPLPGTAERAASRLRAWCWPPAGAPRLPAEGPWGRRWGGELGPQGCAGPHRRLVTQSRRTSPLPRAQQRLLGLRPRAVCWEPAGCSLPQSLRPGPVPAVPPCLLSVHKWQCTRLLRGRPEP